MTMDTVVVIQNEIRMTPEQRNRNRRSDPIPKPTDHKIPESFNAFCNIVSFTAANTNLMFPVSVACVR